MGPLQFLAPECGLHDLCLRSRSFRARPSSAARTRPNSKTLRQVKQRSALTGGAAPQPSRATLLPGWKRVLRRPAIPSRQTDKWPAALARLCIRAADAERGIGGIPDRRRRAATAAQRGGGGGASLSKISGAATSRREMVAALGTRLSPGAELVSRVPRGLRSCAYRRRAIGSPIHRAAAVLAPALTSIFFSAMSSQSSRGASDPSFVTLFPSGFLFFSKLSKRDGAGVRFRFYCSCKVWFGG